MREGLLAVVLVGVLLSCAQPARAECSRGAACLSRSRNVPAPRRGAQDKIPAKPSPAAEPTPASPPAESSPPSVEPPPSYPVGPRRWYGWQLLIIDGAVIGGTGIADLAQVRGRGATALAFSLGLVFDVAPPIVHAVHHRGGIAWASFGVRSTLPLTVLVTTVLLSSCSDPFDTRCLNRTAPSVAAYLGLAAASALDASLFAWDAPITRKPPRATLEWTPVVAPRIDGATVGVVGAF